MSVKYVFVAGVFMLAFVAMAIFAQMTPDPTRDASRSAAARSPGGMGGMGSVPVNLRALELAPLENSAEESPSETEETPLPAFAGV